MIKAIIFDMDGVLVNACKMHYLALNKALKEVSGFELTYDEHIKEFNGLPTKTKLKKLTEQGRIKEEDHQLIFDKKQEHTKYAILYTLKPEPEKLKLFKHIKKADLKMACYTNSILESAQLMLSVSELLGYLDLLISNEDVTKPKPDAEGYIKAMEKLGVTSEETLIVEDSPVGLCAAKSSQAHIWAVNGVEDVTLENFLKRMTKFFDNKK